MTDLATAGAAGATGFADAERREIIMKEEALRGLTAAISVNVLRFFDGREGDERERLRFAALENGGTMGAREHADFARNRTQVLVTAAVHSLLLVEHADAERLFLDVIECL